MNRNNINHFKRILAENVMGSGSRPTFNLDPTQYDTWNDQGFGGPSLNNTPQYNDPVPTRPRQPNPTHDYTTPPRIPNGYLYWNPTTGRWELWQNIETGGSLPRYYYDPNSGQWYQVY